MQKLLRQIRGGVSEEDMSLFEYVSVKDMAKIYQEMGTDKRAQEIWEELKASLLARREKAERKMRELEGRQVELSAERDAAEAEAARLAAEEAARVAAEEEEAAKRKRKEEKKRKKAEEAARNAQAEDERTAAEAEAAEIERLAREEEQRIAAEQQALREKADAKRRRREDKARRLAEEQEALRKEQEENEGSRRRSRNQRKEWEDYVASHPLEFTKETKQEIVQIKKEFDSKPPPSADVQLLSRTYTPQCPNCHAKYAKPPPEWDCPMCLRKFRQRIKTWQPDDNSDSCMCCGAGVGRFSRHHCRNCGRVVCGGCSEAKAVIPSLGFKDPVKCCKDCTKQFTAAAASTAAAGGGGSASPPNAA